MGMAEDRDLSPTHRPSGLEMCTSCGRPFVVPVALLDLIDEGLYLLALQCTNCDRMFTGEVEDADLEELEQANDAAVAEIQSALEVVSVARFIDELGQFTRALEAGGVLPEDF
jgi:hypothetical protein